MAASGSSAAQRAGSAARPPLSMRRVFRLWFPLASSWLLMGAEMPLFTIFVARMLEPKIHLAAYATVVFPVSLVVEGPVIMLLAASTALSRDWDAYVKLRRFMYWMAGALTALHLLLAFTPLYDFVARTLIGAPEEVIEPARIGLRIMTPWTAMIAYRRFHQGVLIRFERSRLVMVGTAVRMLVLTTMLAIGALTAVASGIVVGSTAVAVAVSAEAVFIGWAVRPTLRGALRRARSDSPAITRASFLHFYVPLAMTPLITLFLQPAGAAAMSRMPRDLDSLAVWPAVHGLVFLLRGAGFAFNEVAVALLDEPRAAPALRRFALLVGTVAVGILLLLGLTPMAGFWFGTVSGLDADLTLLAASALIFAVLMPGYQVLQSWYQGVLVHANRTRVITEAVLLYFVVALSALGLAIVYGTWPGVKLALCAFTLGGVAQTAYLAWRSRPSLRRLRERDAGG